jgi:YfiH family protein
VYGGKLSEGFRLEERKGVGILTIPSFTRAGVAKHGFTTRVGGVSPGVYASLNLSMTREENIENKKENYRRACAAVGVPYESLTLVRYAHGDGIHCVAEGDAGKGVSRETDFEPCDAMISDIADVTVLTLHADCVPVLYLDTRNKVAAAVHAGWKGVHLELPKRTVYKMALRYKSRPEDILVGIGPHITVRNFQVRDDVAAPFLEKFGPDVVRRRESGTYVDLQKAVLMQLEEAGVPEGNITCANLCTYTRADLFYSHRRDNGRTGAMGSFISI